MRGRIGADSRVCGVTFDLATITRAAGDSGASI